MKQTIGRGHRWSKGGHGTGTNASKGIGKWGK